MTQRLWSVIILGPPSSGPCLDGCFGGPGAVPVFQLCLCGSRLITGCFMAAGVWKPPSLVQSSKSSLQAQMITRRSRISQTAVWGLRSQGNSLGKSGAPTYGRHLTQPQWTGERRCPSRWTPPWAQVCLNQQVQPDFSLGRFRLRNQGHPPPTPPHHHFRQ